LRPSPTRALGFSVVIALSCQRGHARTKIIGQTLIRANALFVQGFGRMHERPPRRWP